MIAPRLWILAAVAALFLGMVANTYRLSAAVDRAALELVECQAVSARLQGAIDEQNAAVTEWKRLANSAADAAEKAMAEVDRLAASRRQVQADLETWKRRAGENECDAARRLLLEYKR